MSNIFGKNVSFLVSLAALIPLAAGITIVGTGTELSAQAEVIATDSADTSLSVNTPQQTETAIQALETETTIQTPNALTKAPVINSSATSVSQATVLGSDNQPSLQQAVSAAKNPEPTGTESSIDPQQLEQTTLTQEAAMPTADAYAPAPVPGTTATSAASLTTPRDRQITPAETVDSDMAQIDVDPGTRTFGGDSYIGIAGNIGLSGNTPLGDSSFMVISKIGLTTKIAVRPSVAIDTDPVILVPVTFDFSLRPVDAFTERLAIAPYVGGGIAISTGNKSDVGPMVTAGVDFPITPRFTATVAVNAAFLNKTDVGLLVGVGYNFSALGI